jgi:uncharacterized protein (TIGR00369 family)
MDRTRQYSWSDPLALAELGRGRPGLELFQALLAGELPPPPIGDTLGFTLLEASEGRAVFGLEPAEHHYNPIGVVHGGVAATLLDSACGCAVHTLLPAGAGYTSLDLSVRYLRPVTADTGPIRAVGTVLNKGRRTALAEGRLLDSNDKLLAHATSSCMIFPV